MKDVLLADGNTMPAIGLGLWLVKDERKCKDAVEYALDEGYRHFDTAQYYENEAYLGDALTNSKIERNRIFVTTKIKNDNMWWKDLIPSFEESLKKLQLDYVNLLLLHFPVSELRRPAWRKMEELHKQGRAKSIGVSNYTITHLEELLGECSIKPAVNQIELHVYLQQPELVAYCKAHKIIVEAYSPLAHGYGLDNPILQAIAKKHSKTAAQVMIRWCIEVGAVPLPKSVHKERIIENFSVFDFELDDEDMKRMSSLNSGYRTAWDPTHIT